MRSQRLTREATSSGLPATTAASLARSAAFPMMATTRKLICFEGMFRPALRSRLEARAERSLKLRREILTSFVPRLARGEASWRTERMSCAIFMTRF